MHLRNCRLLPGCVIVLLAIAMPAAATTPDPTQSPAASEQPSPEQTKLLALMKQQMDAAVRAIVAGRFDEAIRLAKDAIHTAGKDKSAVGPYEVLANALYQKHDVDGAIAALKKAIEIDPTHGAAYASLGGIAMNAGHPDQAKQYLEQALRVTPDLPGAHERLGVLLQQQGDSAGAIREYELGLLNTAPDYVGAKISLADLYNRTGRTADTVRLLEPIVNPTSKNVTELMILGNAFIATGQANKALPLLSAALQLDRNNIGAGLALGTAQRMAGLNNAALDRLQQVIKATPGLAIARYELGLTYIAMARYPEAREALTAAAKLDPKSMEIAAMLGEEMMLEGKIDQAIAQFQELTKRDDAVLSVYVSLATADMAAKRAADAETALREAAARFPNNPDAFGRLGNLLAQQGRYDEALKMLNQGTQLAPNDPRLLNDIALVQLRLGHNDEALKAARQLVLVDPTGIGPRFLLASIIEVSGDKTEAIAIYRSILVDDPNQAQALNNLASCLIDTGDAKEAVPVARRAAEILHDDADVTDTLGWALLQSGEVPEALLQLRTANRLRRDDPTLLYHLAIAQKMSGDLQTARATLNTALQLPGEFKDAPAARALLAEVSK